LKQNRQKYSILAVLPLALPAFTAGLRLVMDKGGTYTNNATIKIDENASPLLLTLRTVE
jgi:hypothetical protein